MLVSPRYSHVVMKNDPFKVEVEATDRKGKDNPKAKAPRLGDDQEPDHDSSRTALKGR
jgi:hypothetical protein